MTISIHEDGTEIYYKDCLRHLHPALNGGPRP
jgi:hypothetical protein